MNANVLNALIGEGINLYTDLGVDYLEIRDCIDFDGFQHQNAFSTYILKLSPNIEEIWKKLDKGSVRWALYDEERDRCPMSSMGIF
jgi:hypothetical protein